MDIRTFCSRLHQKSVLRNHTRIFKALSTPECTKITMFFLELYKLSHNLLLEGSFYDLQLFSTLHTGSRAHAVCKVERSKIRFSTSQTATVSSMKTLLRKLLTAYLNVKKAYFWKKREKTRENAVWFAKTTTTEEEERKERNICF